MDDGRASCILYLGPQILFSPRLCGWHPFGKDESTFFALFWMPFAGFFHEQGFVAMVWPYRTSARACCAAVGALRLVAAF